MGRHCRAVCVCVYVRACWLKLITGMRESPKTQTSLTRTEMSYDDFYWCVPFIGTQFTGGLVCAAPHAASVRDSLFSRRRSSHSQRQVVMYDCKIYFNQRQIWSWRSCQPKNNEHETSTNWMTSPAIVHLFSFARAFIRARFEQITLPISLNCFSQNFAVFMNPVCWVFLPLLCV